MPVEYSFSYWRKIMKLIICHQKIPMIEPRLINTRIKLEDDIPLSLYEYFKWFKENKKIVIIYGS